MSAEFSAAKLRREVDAQRADEPQTVFVGGDPAALADEIDSRLRQIAPGSPKMSIPPAVLAGWAIAMRSHRCAPVEGSPEAREAVSGDAKAALRQAFHTAPVVYIDESTEWTTPGLAEAWRMADVALSVLRSAPSPQANEVVSGDPLDMGAELGVTWRERIESTVADHLGDDQQAKWIAQAIAAEFGVADNQWVTMRDPYTLPIAAGRDDTPQDSDFTDALARAYDHGRREAANPEVEGQKVSSTLAALSGFLDGLQRKLHPVARHELMAAIVSWRDTARRVADALDGAS